MANAGGVISSYAEYRGYSHEKMFKLIEKNKKRDDRSFKAEPERKQKSESRGDGNSGEKKWKKKAKSAENKSSQRQSYQMLQ